ncbi:MAG: T9SS type A sorting domain-containing protein [Chitinophagaceae bacterium]|nr:T9SS type A sorting domain-containing protein [Chitinophagaceae bacterium]
MKKLLLLMLFVVALNQTTIKAQCPPGAFAYQSLYPQCPSGCGVLLLGWPEGVVVNIYGGTPLTIITNALISGTLGGGGTGDAFTCVPCNTPLVYASAIIGASGGCVIATIGVVPVKITNFSATLSNNSCLLNWTALSETGTVKYIVQKSMDGRNFKDLATLKGTQLPVNNYSYTDAAIKGAAFYRIKVMEISGNTIYTETVLVKNENQFGFSVYPNPANNEFKVAVPSKFLPASMEIINAQGVTVHTQKINQSTYRVNNYLPKGIYAVKVTGSNNESLTQRLIRN